MAGVIFLFPIITPIISLFGGYFIAIYLFGWREEGRLISKQRKARILTLVYFPLPLLVVIGFFFGFNPSLVGITTRPMTLNSWQDWYNCNYKQKIAILQLANPDYSHTEIETLSSRFGENDNNLSIIKRGYQNWPSLSSSNVYAIFQSGTTEMTLE